MTRKGLCLVAALLMTMSAFSGTFALMFVEQVNAAGPQLA